MKEKTAIKILQLTMLYTILLMVAGSVFWFEMVTVPTALTRELHTTQRYSFLVGGWQVFKVVLLFGGGFMAGNLMGRKGVFDTHRELLDRQVAPLNTAIANLHRDVTSTALHSLNQTVGKAIIDGTKLGVKIANEAPQVSRGELLAGLDQFALPPVTGGWQLASGEQDELEAYKTKL